MSNIKDELERKQEDECFALVKYVLEVTCGTNFLDVDIVDDDLDQSLQEQNFLTMIRNEIEQERTASTCIPNIQIENGTQLSSTGNQSLASSDVAITIDLANDNNESVETINLVDLPDTPEEIVILSDSEDSSAVEQNNGAPHKKGNLDLECPICFFNLQHKETMSTICGHIFCSDCIRSAIQVSKKCPKCRKKLTLNRIHPIYL